MQTERKREREMRRVVEQRRRNVNVVIPLMRFLCGVSAQPHTQSSRTVCHEGYPEKPEQGHCRRISSTSSIFSVEAAAAASQHSMKKNKKPPAQIALANFFQRTRTIARIVHLLQKEGGDWDSELLQEALQSEERQEPFDAQLLVTQVLKVDDLPCDISLRFFQWLKGQPPTIFEHNEYTYGVMLNALGRVGRLYEMEELLEEMRLVGCHITSVTRSNIVLWFFKAKEMSGVARHWTTLRQAGIRASPAIYAVYIDFLVKTGQVSKISAVFEEMLRVDCLPSSRTYTVFIEHLVECGNLDAAVKVLRSMQVMLVVPNRVAFKVLINGFAKVGHTHMVLDLLKQMHENFHKPTKQLMPAVKCLQEMGKQEEASALLGEIFLDSRSSIEAHDEDDASDTECTRTAWRSVHSSHPGFDVNAFCQALHEWNPKVEEVLEQESIEWESSLVLEILRRMRCLKSAWKFFFWLKNKAGFKHDSYSCVLLIQRITKSTITVERKDHLIRELFERMRKDAMNFTVPMFNLVMRHFIILGEPEKTLNMFKLTKQFNVEPNDISYGLVIQGFAKSRQGKKATELLKEMEEKGFTLDETTRAEMITCLSLAGKIERAYALFRSSLVSGRSASGVEWKAIMAAYARVGDNAMALQLYEHMRGMGIMPTQDMYELVTEILRKANRLSDVQELAQERGLLKFFGGTKKALQERLLQVLFVFMDGIQSRGKPNKGHKPSSNTQLQSACGL